MTYKPTLPELMAIFKQDPPKGYDANIRFDVKCLKRHLEKKHKAYVTQRDLRVALTFFHADQNLADKLSGLLSLYRSPIPNAKAYADMVDGIWAAKKRS